MARVETIVVGGGIGAGSPFELNFVPIVGSTDPPLLITTDFIFTVPTGANRGLIVGLTDPLASTNRLRVKGGIVSEHANYTSSVVLGQTHTVTGTFSNGFVLLGRDITVNSASGANANPNVIIGTDVNVVSTGALSGNVIIGATVDIEPGSTYTGGVVIGFGITTDCLGGNEVLIGSSITNGANQFSTVIGSGASALGGGSNNTVIGHSATKASGVARAVVIGDDAAAAANDNVVIGQGASSVAGAINGLIISPGGGSLAHANCVLLGSGVTSFQANTFMVTGGTNQPITTMVIGSPTNTINGNGNSLLFRLTNTTGTDRVGGTLTFNSGLGTGAGAVSVISFATPTILATGATAQTATERARFDSGLGVAANTGMMLWDVDNATLERVSVGAAGSGGVGFKVLRIPD